MDADELKLASQRSMAPSVLHFLVCPHSPATGVLLDKSGVPVLTDYRKVDWKGLATAARKAIDHDVPKSVGVYVADDGVDVMDVLHISTSNGMPFRNTPTFESHVKSALTQLSMANFRSGIIQISNLNPGIHINTPMNGKRPPLGALILSIKFTRGTQVMDYLTGASMSLFGSPVMIMTPNGFKSAPITSRIPEFLREWLESEFGVIYGTDCTVTAIHRTFSV